MPQRIFALVAGLIIGIVVALFARNRQKNAGYKHKHGSPDTTNQTFWDMKQELEMLQAKIDAVNRKAAKTGGSTISSGYDYQTACDELEVTDYNLLDEWDRTDTNYHRDAEEAVKFQEINAIDQKLESDEKHEIEEALDQLIDLCYNNPEDVELLYRIGKAHVKLSVDQSEDVVKEHVEKGIEALTTALSLNDMHAEVHKWYGILLGLRSQFQSLQQKAKDGFLLKKHCDIACALKPKDAMLHHILGRFDYEIASLGWLEKTVAKTIFGELSTYTDALTRLMTAEKLSARQHFSIKERIENKKLIGNTLIAMGNERDAMQWFKEAERLESVDNWTLETVPSCSRNSNFPKN